MCLKTVIVSAILLLTTCSTALATTTPEVLTNSTVQSTETQPVTPTTTTTTTDVLPVNTSTQSTQTTQTVAQPGRVDISTGLPTVTPDMFVAKINRMTNSIYGMARGVIPGISVVAIVAAFILGIVFREARPIVAWSLIGLLVVLWAPQIVGFVVGSAEF